MTSGSITPAVAARGMRKSFGDHRVLDEVDLTVTEGTIFALLGPNGAGKTTMVRILSTLIPADAGDIRVAGHDVATEPDGVRAAIGVTGQFSAVDNLLTGRENLRLMADLRHLGRRAGPRRVTELLERFDLTSAADKLLSTYSGGMRRRRLAAKSVETASNTPMFLTLLPLVSSGFVPTATMPPGLRQFAEYQPYTPVTQTVRGLLTGAPTGIHAITAVAWSAGIALVCYLWAVRLYNRRRAAEPK